MKSQNIKITYNQPVEDINKKLKENIISTMKDSIRISALFKLFFPYIFMGVSGGAIISAILYSLYLFITKKIGTAFDNILSIDSRYCFIFFISLCPIVFCTFVIRSYSKSRNAIKKLINKSVSMSYEEFFDEYDVLSSYDNNQFEPLLYGTFLTSAYRQHNKIKEKLLPLSIDIEYYSSFLDITYATDNGDVETTTVSVDNVIKNINVTELEIRFDYNYESTLIVPYKAYQN